MSRRLIALLVSAIAIVFAFGALTAIRWPSIMMFLALFFHPDPSLGLDNINWRELGIAYGAPYFLASLCFYASSISVANRQPGAILWYLMACVAGTPIFFLVDFEPGWYRDPSGPESMVAGGSLIVILLAVAVWELRPRRVPVTAAGEETGDAVTLSQEQLDALIASRMPAAPEPVEEPPRKRHRRPVPAAIARQRAHFAAQGRRMRERRVR